MIIIVEFQLYVRNFIGLAVSREWRVFHVDDMWTSTRGGGVKLMWTVGRGSKIPILLWTSWMDDPLLLQWTIEEQFSKTHSVHFLSFLSYQCHAIPYNISIIYNYKECKNSLKTWNKWKNSLQFLLRRHIFRLLMHPKSLLKY